MFILKCFSVMLKAPLDAVERLNKIWQRENMTAGTFGHFISELESKETQDIPERVWINPRCSTFTGARLHLEASWA